MRPSGLGEATRIPRFSRIQVAVGRIRLCAGLLGLCGPELSLEMTVFLPAGKNLIAERELQ